MAPQRRSRLEGVRVLILEDEFYLADDLARALRDVGADPVGPVGTLEEAEDLVESGRFDAAVLDLNLHGEMAADFIRRLATAKVPCLIVSGYAEDALPESVVGIRRLEKPVSPSAVIECLADELVRAA